MPGQYQNGFSLNDYNKNKKQESRRASLQKDRDDAASEKANEHLKKIQSGKMVSLSLDNDFLTVKFLKNLIRGDSRYFWNQNGDKIHFSARKIVQKSVQENPLRKS